MSRSQGLRRGRGAGGILPGAGTWGLTLGCHRGAGKPRSGQLDVGGSSSLQERGAQWVGDVLRGAHGHRDLALSQPL